MNSSPTQKKKKKKEKKKAQMACLMSVFFNNFLGYRGIVHPPSADVAWLGNLAGQSAMPVAGVRIPCMGTCMVTHAILLALLGWHICVIFVFVFVFFGLQGNCPPSVS